MKLDCMKVSERNDHTTGSSAAPDSGVVANCDTAQMSQCALLLPLHLNKPYRLLQYLEFICFISYKAAWEASTVTLTPETGCKFLSQSQQFK